MQKHAYKNNSENNSIVLQFHPLQSTIFKAVVARRVAMKQSNDLADANN